MLTNIDFSIIYMYIYSLWYLLYNCFIMNRKHVSARIQHCRSHDPTVTTPCCGAIYITSRPSGWVHPEAPGFVDPSDATKHPEMIRQRFWDDLNSLAPLIIPDPNYTTSEYYFESHLKFFKGQVKLTFPIQRVGLKCVSWMSPSNG